MTDNRNYLPYTDSLEQLQPQEAELTGQILASMSRMNQQIFDKHRHAVRDAHAKIHGALKGQLEVYPNLPPHLRQGIFAEPRQYSVIVRLSTAPGDLQSDRIASPRGMAVKVLGVPGSKVLPDDSSHNQDFLLVNHPTIPFGHVAAYAGFQEMLEKAANSPAVASAGSPATPPLPNTHILGETFHSMGSLRFGDFVAKLSAAPLSESTRSLTGASIPEGDSALRDLVVEFFQTQSATYELRAQLLADPQRMPIEDASVLWPEELSPQQPIARLVFLPQDAFSPERRVYSDDVLSFNPWHCVDAHRPLGSIMRIRAKAYEASSRFRHEKNVRLRVEPNDISEFPD